MLKLMMETSSFACVLIFLPAVVGLFPGPPPWSTCHYHHHGGDDVMMTMVMMMAMVAMMAMRMMMMQFFPWPRMVRMVRTGTLSLANRVLMKLFLDPCHQLHSENV